MIATLFLLAAMNWPVEYNAGVTAYRTNDFASAAATFEQATAAPDPALQQRALYNLGNTDYRLGEADPKKAQPLWERALKRYEAALALNPKDEDARFNRDFVKKRLEELQKQKQQQEQEKQKQDQQQQKDNQQQQQKENQQNNQQDKQDKTQQQDNQQQKQDQQKQDQQKQQENQKQDQQQQQAQSKPLQQQESQSQAQQPSQSDKVNKQQATALLDNLREGEQNWNFFPEVQMKDLKDAGQPAKDW